MYKYVNIIVMKRAAIYVYHDKNGFFEDYAVYYVNSLLQVADKVVVVINGDINKEQLLKINNPKIKIIQRENKGYDFWAYKLGFLSLGQENIKIFDEIIFANSSVYGPLFPFDEMFEKMKGKKADFWGITKHPEMSRNIIKFNPKTKIKEHIQSYFMVFRKSLFLHPVFKNYFENLKTVKNKKEAIGCFEVSMTKYFKDKGFNYDVYVDDDILKYGVENYHQYLPMTAVEEYKCPLIKRTIFAKRFDLAERAGQTDETKKVFDFIRNKTNYDINLIVKDITKNYSMGEIKRFLHLDFILSNKQRQNFLNPKCICYFDFSDDEINKIIRSYLRNIFGKVDIKGLCGNSEISFGKEFKIGFLDKNKSYFKQIKEDGLNYDYIFLFCPDFNILNKISLTEKINYTKYLLNCTLNNRIFISNLFDVFQKNSYIGLLTPIPFMFKGFKFSFSDIDKKDFDKFLSDISFTTPFSTDFLNTTPPCFWMKKEMLDCINDCIDFEEKTTLNKGIIFSLLAQKYGFLTGNVSDADTFILYKDKLEYQVLRRNGFLSDIASKIDKYLKSRGK